MEEFVDLKIIIIDDEQEVIDTTKDLLQETLEIKADGMTDPLKALEYLKYNAVDLIILDWRMSPITGDEFITQFREFDPKATIILQTGAVNELPQLETLMKYNIQRIYFKRRRSTTNNYKNIICN